MPDCLKTPPFRPARLEFGRINEPTSDCLLTSRSSVTRPSSSVSATASSTTGLSTRRPLSRAYVDAMEGVSVSLLTLRLYPIHSRSPLIIYAIQCVDLHCSRTCADHLFFARNHRRSNEQVQNKLHKREELIAEARRQYAANKAAKKEESSGELSASPRWTCDCHIDRGSVRRCWNNEDAKMPSRTCFCVTSVMVPHLIKVPTSGGPGTVTGWIHSVAVGIGSVVTAVLHQLRCVRGEC